jgi:hypothetical protein
MPTDPSTYVDRYRGGCVVEPPDEPVPVKETWTGPYAIHNVVPGDSLRGVARRFAASGRAVEGLDWQHLTRFNLGVDHPPHVNWCLIAAYGYTDGNRTLDRKNYKFVGGEELWIPLRESSADGAAVALEESNTVVVRRVEVATVEGPTLVTEGIDSRFRVTGFTVPMTRVARGIKDSVRWKIEDVDAGTETEAPETGMEVELGFTGLGKRFRVYPFVREEDELVCCELRVIRVEFKHEIKLTEVDDELVRPDDPLNKIHNPAGVVIGASAATTVAKYRLTKVEPETFALAPNDGGFTWVTDNTEGEARFHTIDEDEQSTGSECELEGVAAGLIKVQGFTTHAVSACVEMTVKVVAERVIPYRVNFLKRRFILFWTRSSAFTSEKARDTIAIANVHLWQMGMRLEPDTDGTIFTVGRERAEAIDGFPGFYEVNRVPKRYVEGIRYPDVEAGCRINSRSGVVNFNLVISYSSGAWGIGPCAPHNVLSTTVTGPDETGTDKTSGVFDTPKNLTSSEGRAGIMLMDPVVEEAANDNKIGAVIAHELGHNLALWHRGTAVARDQRDGLPMSLWNLMYAFVNRGAHQDTQTDIDVVQLAISHASSLAPGCPDGLRITLSAQRVSGAHNSTHDVTISARRGGLVPDTRFKVWALPYNTRVARITPAGTTVPDNAPSTTGSETIRILLRGTAGDTAQILVMAAERDDLATELIECEVT